MKYLFLTPALAALTTAAAVPLEARQSNMLGSMLGMAAKLMPAANGIVIEEKSSLKVAGIKRQLIRYGPFTIPGNKDGAAPPSPEAGHNHGGGDMPGMSMGGAAPAAPKAAGGGFGDTLSLLAGQKPMDPNGWSTTKRLATGLCKDCTVLSGKTTVVFENGTRADLSKGVYLHHVIAMDVTKPVKSYITGCPGIASSISPFLGGAVDEFRQWYTTPDGQLKAGFYIKNDEFIMQAELVNYHPEPQNVFLQMDIEWVPGKYGPDASQATLAATSCDSATQSFKPQPGTAGEIKSKVYPATADGKIIAARGHMHDGGTAVNMYINDKLVCASKATYGGAGSTLKVNGKEWQTITKMSECADPIAIKKGDNVLITASYDTKTHPLRESHGEAQEGMGIMTFVFVPSS
ncbi:hypothetical protein EJ06DRAFT_518776 [Trichodelitschia bisporula]|uniref:Uncharacterized protein n=1 Tax=Trichodelitschia bisporula TaxID=703511 RepID=A0A6G1I845_9PEZI|nr:hypothetical protein EJ06DRAFT_518776 [Trichodelitschia bisporula]